MVWTLASAMTPQNMLTLTGPLVLSDKVLHSRSQVNDARRIGYFLFCYF